MKTNNHEVIFCIVNTGFSDVAMDAARSCGAGGGTILNARGVASSYAEKLFDITIQPEKEMLMIILEKDIRDAVLHSLYKSVGTGTPAQGIILSMPVEHISGYKNNTGKNSIENQEE